MFFNRKVEEDVKRIEPSIVERQSPIPRVSRKGTRQYHGVNSTAIYADFRSSMLSPDAELADALSKLRARSRNLERNSSHARRFIQLMKDNVVGPGFALSVKAKYQNGELQTRANQALRAAWVEWSDENITADGMMDLTQLVGAVVQAWCRDGEAFIQILNGRDHPDGLGFHQIEADLVDETLNTVDPNGREIRMGVEVTPTGRPVAYWVLHRHPGDHQFAARTHLRKHRRIPADQMIHVFEKRRAGQTRGEPPMCAVMTDVKMLSGYREAELTHRRIAASKMGFFTRENNSGPVAGLADDEDDDGQFFMEANPGTMKALPPGYDFTPFDANSTSTDYGVFERQIIRSIAVGLGPSYFDLGMDLEDVNYSSIRQGALSDRDFYRGFQKFIIRRLLRPIYMRFMRDVAMLNEDLGIMPSKFEAFRKASKFTGRGWSWVDPQKEVKANETAIQNGLTSRTRVLGEQGIEFADVADELAEEKELLDSLGIEANPKAAIKGDKKPSEAEKPSEAKKPKSSDEADK